MKPLKRQNQIVEAAIKLFAKRGYHATQVSDIIDEAKIARGTFYLYFESKHKIFNFILDEFIKHFRSQIKDIELGSPVSPAEQMRGNVDRIVDSVLKRPELAKIIFNEAVGLDKKIDQRLGIFYNDLINIIESSIKRGIQFGLIRHVNTRAAACIVLGGCREILVQNAIFDNVKISKKSIVDSLIDTLLGGLSAKPMLT